MSVPNLAFVAIMWRLASGIRRITQSGALPMKGFVYTAPKSRNLIVCVVGKGGEGDKI